MSTSTTPEALTSIESQRLNTLETAIEKGRAGFLEVGHALEQIRDGRLYRSGYPTFEKYCCEKWNFTRQYINQVIGGARAVKSLPPSMETIVTNPGQARALAQVEPEKREEVINKVIETGKKVTAKAIKAAADELKPLKDPAEQTDTTNFATEKETNFQRSFPEAKASAKRAGRWWFSSTSPKLRGSFFKLIICADKKVEVHDKAKFIELVTRWLEKHVSEKESA